PLSSSKREICVSVNCDLRGLVANFVPLAVSSSLSQRINSEHRREFCVRLCSVSVKSGWILLDQLLKGSIPCRVRLPRSPLMSIVSPHFIPNTRFSSTSF